MQNDLTLPRGFEVAKVASLQSNARHSRKVGAALYAGSILLSVGYNSYGMTHPEAAKHKNIHAEHRALIRRRYHPNNRYLTIYIYRENANGIPSCSRPCDNCLSLLADAGVKTVRYINLEGIIEEMTIREAII